MECRIIRAGIEDAAIVGEITSRSWQAAYKGIVPDEYLAKVTPEFRTERFRSIVAGNPGIEFYLVSVDGAPAGVFNLHRGLEEDVRGCGEIGVFYFLPETWGTGCAAPAMAFALKRLRELGYSEVVLNVLEDNVRARRFYEKQEFQPDGGRFVMNLGTELFHVRYRRGL